ncbi:hypothetical protein [Novosphingobium sp. KA1]|uniref:hypothetical protein n=1 Tax=Novosphingobium sp. (strain KA1) TaxID=164608 RepID=UPI001A8D42B4|nr:hypothetical protein [Novosphingobium sp. KA1]
MREPATVACQGYWDLNRAWKEIVRIADALDIPQNALKREPPYGKGGQVIIPFYCEIDGISEEEAIIKQTEIISALYLGM